MKKTHLQKTFLALAGMGLCLSALVFFSAAAPETSRVISPHFQEINESITTTGIVTPRNRLEIRPPVAGRLDALLVKEGDKVTKGQPLITMSSTDRATLIDAAYRKGDAELKYWQEVYKPIQMVSPMDATVIVATLQPGQMIATIDPIVVLSDQLIVRAQVDETDIARVSLGQKAFVTLDSFPQNPIEAAVEHIYYESVVQSNVTVYKVDLNVTKVPDFFRSGMNAQVAFQVAQKDKALVLPAEAVDFSSGKPMVMIVDDKGKEEPREIVAGITTPKFVEVVSGLTETSKVAIKNQKINLNAPESGKNPFMPQFRQRR